MAKKKMQIITINIPKSATLKLKMIMKIITGKPIEIISMNKIMEDCEIETEKLHCWLKKQRPFIANIQDEDSDGS